MKHYAVFSHISNDDWTNPNTLLQCHGDNESQNLIIQVAHCVCFRGLWRGVLYHVSGRQEWAFGRGSKVLFVIGQPRSWRNFTTMLTYASKRYSFDPSAYEARALLAALDYSFHNHRAPTLNGKGQKMFS